MTKPSYEEVEHTADWSLRVHGHDLPELFVVAASAMLAACGARAAEGSPTATSTTLTADDREGLLVRWLEELLYRLEPMGRYPTSLQVELEGSTRLHASWEERPLGGVEKPIKAVTFHNLRIEEDAEGWTATIVFDV